MAQISVATGTFFSFGFFLYHCTTYCLHVVVFLGTLLFFLGGGQAIRWALDLHRGEIGDRTTRGVDHTPLRLGLGFSGMKRSLPYPYFSPGRVPPLFSLYWAPQGVVVIDPYHSQAIHILDQPYGMNGWNGEWCPRGCQKRVKEPFLSQVLVSLIVSCFPGFFWQMNHLFWRHFVIFCVFVANELFSRKTDLNLMHHPRDSFGPHSMEKRHVLRWRPRRTIFG